MSSHGGGTLRPSSTGLDVGREGRTRFSYAIVHLTTPALPRVALLVVNDRQAHHCRDERQKGREKNRGWWGCERRRRVLSLLRERGRAPACLPHLLPLPPHDPPPL